ncbi:MAG TPA: hypothetical protein VLA43_07875 [Longimicrobiales bacterium]|nr:hypothetical protein [Longimicrobiales bacterium]
MSGDADVVFSMTWGSGSPGVGAHADEVFRIDGKYWAEGWLESGGPFDTLAEAVATLTGDDGIYVSDSTWAIWCSEWNEDEILARISTLEEPDAVTINGAHWPLERLEFERERRRRTER